MVLSAMSAHSMLVCPNGSHEVDLAKLWPEHIHEHQLAVGALPYQEAAQPLFSNFVNFYLALLGHLSYLSDRLDEFLLTTICYRDVKKHRIIIGSRLFQLCQYLLQIIGE